MDKNEKILSILLKFALDNQSISRIKSGVTSLETELDRAKVKALSVQSALVSISEESQRASQKFARVFATGTVMTGGIFAVAERYVRSAKSADATTKAWIQSTDRLTQAQSRIGAIVAREALPLMEKAAELASKAATFIEKNPDVVKAAMNIGMVTATLGAVGMAVTKGIQLYADAKMVLVGIQQLAAGKLMADAAKAQLAAAAAGKLSGGQIAQNLRGAFGLGTAGAAGAGGAGGLSATLLPIVTTVVALLAGSYLGTKLGNMGGKAIYGDEWKDKGFADSMKEVWKTTRQIALLASPITLVAAAAEKLGIISKETQAKIWDLMKSIAGLGDKAESGSKGAQVSDKSGSLVRVTDEQRQMVDAYVDMLKQEREAAAQYAEDRLDIIRSAQQRELQIVMNYHSTVGGIVRNYNKSVTQITANYQKQNLQSERAYAEQRAQVIRDSGVEIRRMEEDHQANLRRLRQEHEDRVTDLVSSRDALGLVREMRDYEKRRSAEEENANKQIARRREDVARTLRDMAAQHAAERAQRLADYKAQLKEAALQKAEQLKQARANYLAELSQLAKAKQDALRMLAEQYNTERQRRREAFIAQVRDLDSAMNGERKRKNAYYAAMLKDVEAFTAAYRRSLPSGGGRSGGGTLPIRDQGGYATKGVYRLAQDGRTEFVLSGDSTKAAEQLIGGRLTQDNLLSALRGGRSQVTWNDNRRFDSRLSGEDRRAIQNDTMQTLAGVLNGI